MEKISTKLLTMTIMKQILKYIYLILAPIILAYIFYTRFLNKKTALILVPLSFYYIVLYIILSFIGIITLISLLQLMIFKRKKETIFSKILKKHNLLYLNSLKTVDMFIKNVIKKKYNIKKALGYILPPIKKNNTLKNNMYLIIYIIPKLILSLFFIIDIFYYHCFSLFYSFIFLILPSLIFDYFIFSLRTDLQQNVIEIDPNIEIRNKADESTITLKDDEMILEFPKTIPLQQYIHNIVVLKKSISSYEMNLSYYYFVNKKDIDPDHLLKNYKNFFYLLYDMYYILYLFDKQKTKLQPYFMVFYTSILTIGWLYIIFLNY
jgi:hypothetical protein